MGPLPEQYIFLKLLSHQSSPLFKKKLITVIYIIIVTVIVVVVVCVCNLVHRTHIELLQEPCGVGPLLSLQTRGWNSGLQACSASVFSCQAVSWALSVLLQVWLAVIFDFEEHFCPYRHMSLINVPERELDKLQLRTKSPIISLFYFILFLLKNLNIPELPNLVFEQSSPRKGVVFLLFGTQTQGLA